MAAIQWAPFSKTGLRSITGCTSFINIFEGAVRSSKTVCSIIAWLDFVEKSPHREFLMTGKTSDTLYRNVIDGGVGIISIMGEKRAKYVKGGDGGAHLKLKFRNPNKASERKWIEKICYCIGGNDEKSEGRVRGMTVAGWYADEVTLYPESFTKQCLNRMSLSGSRAIWTTNPDSPYHPVYTEYIEKAKEKGYKVFHFELDDNLSLDPWYKENIKKAYSGLWYKRMILGLWVMADGVIYDMFDHEAHVVDVLPDMNRYWLACDYGTSNATTFILSGLGVDGRLYIIDEYYHSGSQSGQQKSHDEHVGQKSPQMYSADFKKWLEHCGDVMGKRIDYDRLFIDPSAEAFIVQLWSDGVRKIAKADNAVKNGIELVSTIMTLDRFRVHRRCKNVLRELSSYVWDPKAQKLGEDKPMKTNDHCLDPIRYIANGTRSIWVNRRAS